MNKCCLCQQIYNNLTIIYNNRLKSLTQIILKLKGFKDSWDLNNDLKICEMCLKGVENVALFWENIPEAKKDTAGINKELKEENAAVSCSMEPNLPALKLDTKEENQQEMGKKMEPIKLLLKLPRKRKKEVACNSKNIAITKEPLEKRTRRCPQRYEDYQLDLNKGFSILKEENSSDACNEICFDDLPQVALLRLDNSQNIGILAEVESKGDACKMRISCQICCQVFRFEKLFQKHIKTHYPAEDNFKNYLYHCKLCDKPFSNHRTVRNHFKLTHSEERLFKCSDCEASFKFKFNLNYHISTKHVPNKRFECTFCKKSFVMRYELQIHVRTHTKERPYKCEHCSFASAHKSNLKTHKRIHENSTKTTISTKQFMPPEELIEQEQEFLNDKNITYSTELQGTNISEESSLSNELVEVTEALLDRGNILENCSSVNYEQSNTSNEQIKPMEAFVNQGITSSQYDLNAKNISTSAILTSYESFAQNLKENNEATVTKTMFRTKDSADTNTGSETELPNLESNTILTITATNKNTEEVLKPQPILGVFQLDKSLLKVLPSASLLGLKKWPKSFQNTPTNQLQLVKSSTFSHHKNAEKFEIIQNLKDFTEASEKTLENSTDLTNYFMKYSSLQQTECLKTISPPPGDNNTPSILDQTVSNLVSSNLNLTTKSYGVLEATNDQPINISDLEKQNNLIRDIDNNYKTCEINMPPGSQTSNKNNYSMTTQAVNKNLTSNEISASERLANVTKTPNENLKTNILLNNSSLKPYKIVSHVTGQSLLKPSAYKPQAPSLFFTTPTISQTILHNKPLITNIEILPPLKMLTTLQKSPTTANLIKPPNEYKFQCPYCYKYFKQKSPLTKHLRTHTGEKPYKCNLCPKSYADSSNYKKHKILHKNAAEALNISGKTTTYAAQSSPAYSTVSDPDPDGIEIMQSLKKFYCSSTEADDDDDIDDNCSDYSNMEAQMWEGTLDQALNSEEMKANIRTNLMAINNVILPKSMQQITNTIDINKKLPTEDPD